MDIERIDPTRIPSPPLSRRIHDRDSFIGQKQIVKIVSTALQGAKKSQTPLGHILLTGPSGHGKTTLARLIGDDLGVRVHQVTAYAFSKPADLLSLLNSLQPGDVLFLDELHRCKPVIEEILYVAMEDFAIDMILPDGKPLRLQLHPFTLIGATTKPESLSAPLKNRFVYKLHFMEYTPAEKTHLLAVHFSQLGILCTNKSLLSTISTYTTSVPREISNLSKQLFDRLVAHYGCDDTQINPERRHIFWQDYQLQQGGLTPLHQHYLDLLQDAYPKALGVKTLATTLGVHEKTLEEDIEPLLLKLGKIEKTGKGRVFKQK